LNGLNGRWKNRGEEEEEKEEQWLLPILDKE
jgi:hypothetical protein